MPDPTAPKRTPPDDTTTPVTHTPPDEATCPERWASLGVAHACSWISHEGDVHKCVCGDVWGHKPAAPETVEDPPQNVFDELRPLFDALDEEHQAASAAMAADDMQTWVEHAGRGAEIQEEIAQRLGWRKGSTRDR